VNGKMIPMLQSEKDSCYDINTGNSEWVTVHISLLCHREAELLDQGVEHLLDLLDTNLVNYLHRILN
jgi:hypothetical protein